MIEKLKASVFHRFMTSGRTSPMLATCLTRGDEDIDVVVKLNGSMDFGCKAAMFELVGSLMAIRLGIGCAKPFLVWISPEFAQAVVARHPSKEKSLQSSVGWNFGSEMMKDAMIWASDSPIPTAMSSDALRIFCFDGLTQNADRAVNNPNLMTRGDRLTVIDHECSFSFLTSIIRSSKPWTMGAGDYMDRHALRRGLKGMNLDWTSCLESLLQLSDDFFETVGESLPMDWKAADDFTEIRRHVSIVLEHVDQFGAELQRRIA